MNTAEPQTAIDAPPDDQHLLMLNMQLQEEIALLRSELAILRTAANFYFNEATAAIIGPATA